MYRLEHTTRHYAWGSKTAFAELFDLPQSHEPTAELWFGTHPVSPSTLADGRLLTDLTDLPYLLKIIAAEKPLSIQSHPNLAQAVTGYARENAAGIPLDSPIRNYKDPNHKPELLLALTNFSALCGFRSHSQSEGTWRNVSALVPSFLTGPHTNSALDLLNQVSTALGQQDYKEAVRLILSGDAAATAIVTALQAAAEVNPEYVESDLSIKTAVSICHHYQQDPGALVALLMQRVDLVPGQAIYLTAGIVHAYLHGLGVEVMACSDNVLRGGLTEKHIDVDELLAVSHFQPSADPLLAPATVVDGVSTFHPESAGFQIDVIREANQRPVPKASEQLLLCLQGALHLTAGAEALKLTAGQAAYVPKTDQTCLIRLLPADSSQGQESPLAVAVTSGLS